MPKMLRRKGIVETLALGCQDGYLVPRLTRPDTSVRTLLANSSADRLAENTHGQGQKWLTNSQSGVAP